MNGVATGGIKAVCPECRATKTLSHAELGHTVECWDCGTSFYVVRQRWRKRVSHMPRTECLLRQSGPASPPQSEIRRAMSLVFLLLIIAMSGAFIVANWSGVVEKAREAGTLLSPPVPVAPEVPVVEPEPQTRPR